MGLVLASFLAATPVAVASSLLAAGCLKQPQGPSTVGAGKEYSSGDPNYDDFFGSLYKAQLLMGQAPDREKTIVGNLGKAAGAEANAETEDVVLAVKRRAAELAKNGVTMKLAVSGLDGDDKPAVAFSKAGTPEGDAKETVDAVEIAATDAVNLVNDLRRSTRSIDNLGADVGGLEKGVDKAFPMSGAAKRAEVMQNLKDAEKLMPLMTQRGKDVESATVALLEKLVKALGAAPAVTPHADENEPLPKKTKEHKPKGEAGPKAESKPSAPKAESKPAEPPEEPKAAEPKPAKKASPSDDFEP